MNKTSSFILSALIVGALTGASGLALAGKGGEGNNTHCNGVGNANSPCAGTPGPQGPKGDTGAPGKDGRDGKDGTNGTNGRDGAAGADGKDGSQGTAGAAGADGKTGTAGATGATGAAGRDAVLPADIVTQGQLNSATQQLGQRIDANDKRAMAGVSAAIAFASMPQTSDPDSMAMTAGVGTYGGEVGMAVGGSWRNRDGDIVGKAGLTFGSRGQVGIGAGVAYQWK